MLPPTSQLPLIKSISKHPLEALENAVEYLRLIYNPPVRGSSRRKGVSGIPKEKKASNEDDSEKQLESLRTDSFERTYSIRWLTAVISQLEVDEEEAESEPGGSNGSANQHRQREALIENAASLLATCAGTASAGLITRCFTFDLMDSSTPITIELTDVPLDNQDYGSVGAQTWGGACVMAEMITDSPETFGLPTSLSHSSTVRCLELGAGTGLVGLTVAKTMERLIYQHKMDLDVEVLATDYYPSVLANLERNVKSNFRIADTTTTHNQLRISTSRLDWSTFYELENIPTTLEGGFDVIYGADIIYEAHHAIWIKRCLAKLLRKPFHPSHQQPTFHLIIPLRATHAVESSTIEKVFQNSGYSDDWALVIKHKEIVICDAESGKDGEEVEYAYYRIGWSAHKTTDT